MGREGGLFVDFFVSFLLFFFNVEEYFILRRYNRLNMTTDASGIKERCILYDC